MINYRISVAGDFETAPSLFGFWGFLAVYLATGGYPRKVVFLCHQVVLKLIIRGKNKAGWFMVMSCINETAKPLFKRLRWALISLLIIIVLGISINAITLPSLNSNEHKQLPAHPATPILSGVKPAESANVAVTNSVVIPETENQDVKMPDYIGKISMTKRRTIWWILYNIYGETSSNIMNIVFAANPHIKNKDIVMEGTIVTLPSIPADVRQINQGGIVIALKSGQDLETMYNIFRNNPDEQKLPPLAFLSFWNKKEGFEFAIVIDKCFNDINLAKEAVGKLPRAIAAKAKILSQWDADTVFFNRRMLRH